MKKYKLIKKYPSLPSDWEEGMIVKRITPHNLYLSYWPESDKHYVESVPPREVENYPEFWEEVKDNYEILDKDYIPGYRSFGSNDNSNMWKIKTIKRLSDREIFSIGDKVEHKKGAKFTIKDIRIYEGNLQLTSGTGIVASIGNIEHQKEPLFVTEDGVEIFEGDSYYFVTSHWRIFKELPANKFSGKSTGIKYFSTKEAAKKYVDENKPRYSKKDIKNLIDNASTTSDYYCYKKELLSYLDNDTRS